MHTHTHTHTHTHSWQAELDAKAEDLLAISTQHDALRLQVGWGRGWFGGSGCENGCMDQLAP